MLLTTFDPTQHYSHHKQEDLVNACGLIPDWVLTFAALEGRRTNSLIEYLDSRYQHGGGWENTREYIPWQFDPENGTLSADYPNSPREFYYPYLRIALSFSGVYGGHADARFWQYPHGWIVVEENGDWQVARMD